MCSETIKCQYVQQWASRSIVVIDARLQLWLNYVITAKLWICLDLQCFVLQKYLVLCYTKQWEILHMHSLVSNVAQLVLFWFTTPIVSKSWHFWLLQNISFHCYLQSYSLQNIRAYHQKNFNTFCNFFKKGNSCFHLQ